MEFQKSVILLQKCGFSPKKFQNLIFVRNVLFRLRSTKIKTASHSDHPLKRHGRLCVSHFGPFYCLMQFALKYATLCYLNGQILRLSAQIGRGFQFCICIHVDNNFRQKSKFRNFWSKTCFFKAKFKDFWNSTITSFYSCSSHYY